MSQKSIYEKTNGSPMEKEQLQPTAHYEFEKGSATVYGHLDVERAKKGFQEFLESLDRRGVLDDILENIRSK